MTLSRSCFALFCLLRLSSADQVVLKNGDTISGSIIKKDGERLTLKSEFLGDVSLPWNAVVNIRTDESLTVVLPAGETVSGRLSTSGRSLEIAGPAAPRSVPLASVEALRNAAEQHSWERLQRPSLLQLWSGSFDIGLALARGNARTETFTSSFDASRITRRDKIRLFYKQIHGTARVDDLTETIASAVRGGWSYSRDITPRFFVNTLNDYEHDRFQDLDLRFAAGAGFGVNVIKVERATLSLSGGGNYARESFTQGIERDSAEANFGNDLLYKFSNITTVTQAFRFFSNLSDRGEYRVNFDLSAVTAVNRWLGWHVTASDRFLSNPVLGRQRNDVLISTGFRLSFAR
jgi:hypothetical protein